MQLYSYTKNISILFHNLPDCPNRTSRNDIITKLNAKNKVCQKRIFFKLHAKEKLSVLLLNYKNSIILYNINYIEN